MTVRATTLCLVLAGLTACGADDEQPPVDTPGALRAQIGPVSLAAGEERTRCVTVQLDNEAPVIVTRMTMEMSPGGHHLIAYRSESASPAAEEQCDTFQGVLNAGDMPLMIGQRGEGQDELLFPPGVGVRFEAKQMIMLEGHFVNTGAQPLDGTGSVGFEAVEDDGELEESNVAFWGTAKIDLAPGAAYDTPVHFQPGMEGTRGFALTTHQHRLGTGMRVWYSTEASVTDEEPLVDSADWAEPEFVTLDPLVEFDGNSGLSYQCSWSNSTSAEVHFGESALDEMCFACMYYYPSRGFDLCVDGVCINR